MNMQVSAMRYVTPVDPVQPPPRLHLRLIARRGDQRPFCPRCEAPTLIEMLRSGIPIDRCRRCGGVWLDAGELEGLVASYGERVDRAAEEIATTAGCSKRRSTEIA